MSQEIYTIGGTIESKCPKCKKMTKHILIAAVEDRPTRVQCTLCEGLHPYRPMKTSRPPKERTKSRRVSGPRKAAPVLQEDWAQLVQGLDWGKAIRYDMSVRFSVNDLVRHPIFGVGLVRKTIKPDKMRVVFENGTKLLRCAL